MTTFQFIMLFVPMLFSAFLIRSLKKAWAMQDQYLDDANRALKDSRYYLGREAHYQTAFNTVLLRVKGHVVEDDVYKVVKELNDKLGDESAKKLDELFEEANKRLADVAKVIKHRGSPR